jgi:acylphosphatase
MRVSGEAAAERRDVYYSGRVQGVGFRYTVRWAASRFAVTGYVKNLSDGRVQLAVEGRPDEVQRLIDQVDAEMGRYVAEKREQVGPASGGFQGFEIRY